MVRRHRMVILGFMALVLLVLLAVVITRPAAAQDAQQAAEGYRIANQWCASCHMIEPGGGASDVAPGFQQTADNPGRTSAQLRTWLSAPHADMPDFNLSRPDIAALIAYIESLRGG